MGTCAVITANITFDCDNPPVAGNEDVLWVINKAEWDNATLTPNGTNPQLIEGITLATGDFLFKYEGKNNSVEPTQKLVKGKYTESYDHEVTFKVFKTDAATKEQLEKLASGRVVAILENRFRGDTGASAFEIYGSDVGMEVQELTRTLNDADTQGAFNLILRSPEISKEGHLPASLFVTSYAATKAVIEALVSP